MRCVLRSAVALSVSLSPPCILLVSVQVHLGLAPVGAAGSGSANTGGDGDGNGKLIRGVCIEHARRSIRTHYKALFAPPARGIDNKTHSRNVHKTYTKMRADLLLFQGQPNGHHEKAVLVLCTKKWELIYIEPRIAAQFVKSWMVEGTCLGLASLSSIGGLPCHQNALEGKNGGQKGDLEFRRHTVTNFVPIFVNWLANESLEDTGMAESMSLYSNDPFDVWNAKMFAKAFEQYSLFMEGFGGEKEQGIFGLRTKRSDADGLLILDVPSTATIALLLKIPQVKDNKKSLMLALHHVGTCKGEAAGCTGCSKSWYEVYRRLQVPAATPDPLLDQHHSPLHILAHPRPGRIREASFHPP